MIAITLLYASILTVMFLVLSYHVIFMRYKLGISVGDGGNPELQKLLQARNNLSDYAPFGLFLMLVLEITELDPALLHGFGIAIVASRLLQGWGLSMSAGASMGRILGALLMHFTLIIEVILCLGKFLLTTKLI